MWLTFLLCAAIFPFNDSFCLSFFSFTETSKSVFSRETNKTIFVECIRTGQIIDRRASIKIIKTVSSNSWFFAEFESIFFSHFYICSEKKSTKIFQCFFVSYLKVFTEKLILGNHYGYANNGQYEYQNYQAQPQQNQPPGQPQPPGPGQPPNQAPPPPPPNYHPGYQNYGYQQNYNYQQRWALFSKFWKSKFIFQSANARRI